MATEKSKNTRTRNWTAVVYPDSAPENWREIINDLHIEWIESPLHDRDLNATNEIKKPHWHILLLFGGVKSYEQVKDLTDKINCPIPQRCHNAKAMVRYMSHMDNPEKAQYNKDDVKAYGGVDLAEFYRPNSSERYTIVREMINFVKSNNIIEYKDLVDYAMENHFDDWFPLLCDSCTYVVNQYIKSTRYKKQVIVDEETGEIIN